MSSKVKKVFVDLIAHLEANADKKVKSILPEIIAMCEAKQGGGAGHASTFVKNDKGEVVAVRCFYHKLWMSPQVADFGGKASSSTGLNSMCKDGVSKWTKQQRDFKAAQSDLLMKVASGEIQPSQLASEMEALEAARNVIVPREDGYGFATAQECLDDMANRGIDFGTPVNVPGDVAEE